MNLFTGIIVYILTWWITLFMVLPIGVRRDTGGPDTTAHGAPENPKLGFKFALTTGISAVIWVVIFILIDMKVIDFRDIAKTMRTEAVS